MWVSNRSVWTSLLGTFHTNLMPVFDRQGIIVWRVDSKYIYINLIFSRDDRCGKNLRASVMKKINTQELLWKEHNWLAEYSGITYSSALRLGRLRSSAAELQPSQAALTAFPDRREEAGIATKQLPDADIKPGPSKTWAPSWGTVRGGGGRPVATRWNMIHDRNRRPSHPTSFVSPFVSFLRNCWQQSDIIL